ncbi:MAG TPA: hypothetical protein VJB94_03295 [Candidatus Nanoarchaeia archaeon]|nr:hypothetical protein [Candidatus Nanoarchaeia archaeon]
MITRTKSKMRIPKESLIFYINNKNDTKNFNEKWVKEAIAFLKGA